ncbi:hypothetical protein Gohar_003302, partial [Gossypium harknessii]|nr:hypothetical protein [Gossypium harknessii]
MMMIISPFTRPHLLLLLLLILDDMACINLFLELFRFLHNLFLIEMLLSTISDGILVYLISACSSFDVWSIVVRRFATKSSLTVSTMRHSLYFQKKGQLTIQEYLSKIKSLCDTLLAARNVISKQEQASIVLASLPVECESIRIVASTMNVPLDLLTEMLTDCEARQLDFVSNISLQANILNIMSLMIDVLD